MQIYDFLKVKKVKCIDVSGMCLSKDKEYQLLGITDRSCIINDDNGYEIFASIERFEPVLDNDISKSAQDNIFKVGDKVYLPNIAEGEVLTLLDNKACHYPFFVNVVNRVNNSIYELDSNGKTKYGNFTDVVLKATQENYEMLCNLYPHIKFELPPKEITGSDLTKGMFERGDFAVVCKCSNTSESNAITSEVFRVITECFNGRFLENTGNFWEYAVPFDPKTNLPLTEDVLNDID